MTRRNLAALAIFISAFFSSPAYSGEYVSQKIYADLYIWYVTKNSALEKTRSVLSACDLHDVANKIKRPEDKEQILLYLEQRLPELGKPADQENIQEHLIPLQTLYHGFSIGYTDGISEFMKKLSEEEKSESCRRHAGHAVAYFME